MCKKSLLFYDGSCGLCDQCVQFILKRDKNKKFLFAPLQGEAAKSALLSLSAEEKNIDSMVFIEDYLSGDQKIYLQGKAVLRILWLLGGFWKILGVMHFLPACLYNWMYRLVAKNRYRFYPEIHCVIQDPSYQDRFLS
jgi:predicted DCC family thiol-disulfide oxidoreductase YuxK